jgi:CheY-like chemotaxis protein
MSARRTAARAGCSARSEEVPKHWRRRDVVAKSPGDASSSEHDVFEPRDSARAGESRARARLAGLTVLVVDDDEGNLDYFAMALRAYGARVATASTAVEGLRLVKEQRPHVVLSDIAMVGHDGYWLVREIRRLADESIRSVPVVATTAYGREHSRARTLAAGFTEHLPKPVEPDVLCQTIADVAGR